MEALAFLVGVFVGFKILEFLDARYWPEEPEDKSPAIGFHSPDLEAEAEYYEEDE